MPQSEIWKPALTTIFNSGFPSSFITQLTTLENQFPLLRNCAGTIIDFPSKRKKKSVMTGS